MSGNYPPGVSDRTPDAPWNWPENDPIPFDAEVQQTLHKVTEVYTDQYIAEGEWQGSQWLQYRWSSKLEDKDVLYWIELYWLDSDLPKEE